MSPNVVFYVDTIKSATGSTRANSRDQIGADMVISAPLMTLGKAAGSLSLVSGTVPVLTIPSDGFQPQRFSRGADTVTVSGVNPATVYGTWTVDKATGTGITKKGQVWNEFNGVPNSAMFTTTAAVGPLSMFVYDNVARPGEDSSSKTLFDTGSGLLSFTSGDTRNSRPSTVLRE